MIKIKNTSLASVGTYFGQNKDNGENTLENITYDSLKRLAKIYCSVPLTYEHNSNKILGYVDNISVVQNCMLGDLNLYSDIDVEKCLSKFISPEFILDDNNSPKAIVYFSIVENPAITDNLKIISNDDLTVLNAKSKTPYRFKKNRVIEISDNDACDFCKKVSRETKSKPVTFENAQKRLPLHKNCRCEIKKI